MNQPSVRTLSFLAVIVLTLGGLFSSATLSAQEAQPTQAPTAVIPTPRPTASAPVAKSPLLSAVDLQTVLEQVYEKVNPSVVTVWGEIEYPGEAQSAVDGENTQGRAVKRGRNASGAEIGLSTLDWPLGSGFIWDKTGHIVTNNHVVDGASVFSIAFADGLRVSAELVAQEPDSDLAVLKVDPAGLDLLPIAVGDSIRVRVGQPVIVIGNPLGYYEGSLTFGVVSALGRSLSPEYTLEMFFKPTYQIPDIIQTDAALNPGNSGGVMVDLEGRLLGVPAAGVDDTEGLGLVIPSVIVKRVVPALIEEGRYEYPWLGIYSTALYPDLVNAMKWPKTQRGAFVMAVAADSPADAADIRGSSKLIVTDDTTLSVGGDLITAIDSQPVRRPEDLDIYLIRNASVGEDVTLSFIRGSAAMTTTLTVAARPDDDDPEEEEMPEGASAPVWLGIDPFTLTPEIAEAMALDKNRTGVLIQTLVTGSPADKARLRGGYKTYTLENGYTITIGGDVIIAADDRSVEDIDGLIAVLKEKSPGDTVTLTVLRDGEQVDVSVILGAPPSGTM